jgi:hypothetical protein
MFLIVLLVAVICGIIWMFVSEDICTRRQLQFLAELDKLNSNENFEAKKLY